MNRTITFNETTRAVCFTVELVTAVVIVEGTETFFLKLVNPVSADVSDVGFSAGDTAIVIINDPNGTKCQVAIPSQKKSTTILNMNSCVQYHCDIEIVCVMVFPSNCSSAIVVTVTGEDMVQEGSGEVVLVYSYMGVDAIGENITLVVNISTIPLTASGKNLSASKFGIYNFRRIRNYFSV